MPQTITWLVSDQFSTQEIPQVITNEELELVSERLEKFNSDAGVFMKNGQIYIKCSKLTLALMEMWP